MLSPWLLLCALGSLPRTPASSRPGEASCPSLPPPGARSAPLQLEGGPRAPELAFLQALGRARWGRPDLAAFGLCDPGPPAPLRELGAWLGGPRGRLAVLPLLAVIWEPEPTLHFQEPPARAPNPPELALLVLYPHPAAGAPQTPLSIAGPTLLGTQSFCPTPDTRFLALGLEPAAALLPGGLVLTQQASEHGPALSPAQLRALLVGTPQACAPAAPALLLLDAPPASPPAPPAPLLSARLTPPSRPSEDPAESEPELPHLSSRSGDAFAVALAHLVRALRGPEPPLPGPALDPATLAALPGDPALDLRDPATLEALLDAGDEPLLLLLPGPAGTPEPPASPAPPTRLGLRLASELRAAASALRRLPGLRPEVAPLLGRLLAGAGPAPRALLLLQALRALRTERGRRGARGVGGGGPGPCALRELRVDLRAERSVLLPAAYRARDCGGACTWPQSDRNPRYASHAVLLLKLRAAGRPGVRAPCCVPTAYAPKLLVTLSGRRLRARRVPNMVATECGCR